MADKYIFVGFTVTLVFLVNSNTCFFLTMTHVLENMIILSTHIVVFSSYLKA